MALEYVDHSVNCEFIGPTDPDIAHTLVAGQTWTDTSGSPYVLKVWNSASWDVIGSLIAGGTSVPATVYREKRSMWTFVQAGTPSPAEEGDTWYWPGLGVQTFNGATWDAFAPMFILIDLLPNVLTPACALGGNPPADSFSVRNSGMATLNYTCSPDVGWIASAVPGSGSSTGEWDPITVNYAASGLSAGVHVGHVIVGDPAANNNPQNVTVTITVSPPPFGISGYVWSGGIPGAVNYNVCDKIDFASHALSLANHIQISAPRQVQQSFSLPERGYHCGGRAENSYPTFPYYADCARLQFATEVVTNSVFAYTTVNYCSCGIGLQSNPHGWSVGAQVATGMLNPPVNCVTEFDLVAETQLNLWTTNLPRAISHPGGASFVARAHYFGGYISSGVPSNFVDRFTYATKTAADVSTVPATIAYTAVVSDATYAWLIGSSQPNSALCYKWQESTEAFVPYVHTLPTNTGRQTPVSASLFGYTCGGTIDASGGINRVDLVDFSTDVLSTLVSTLQIPRWRGVGLAYL